MRRIRQLFLVLLAAVIVAGCSSSADVRVETGTDGDDPPAVDEGIESALVDDLPELRVFCGSVEFVGRSIDLTIYPVFTDPLIDFIDEQFMGEFELEAEAGMLDLTLYEIERTEDRIHLMGSNDDGSYREIAFNRVDGEWRFDIWGGCRPQIDVDDFGISELALDPANEPTAASTSVDLLVTERECASGELPDGREVSPVVLETGASVDIVVLIEPTRGGADCQGNPSFPLTVELAEPLGERTIRNIAFEPPIDLEWPIPREPSEMWVEMVGEPPTPGMANAMVFEGDIEEMEGLLLDERGWLDFGGGPITGFYGPVGPVTITGFVTDCGETEACLDGGCLVEGDPYFEEGIDDGYPACTDFEPLGERCSVVYEYDPLQNATVKITYSNDSCTIELERTPLP